MQLVTLGALALPDTSTRRARPSMLLTYVRLAGPVPRPRLARLLWPDASDERNSEREAVHALRALDPDLIVDTPAALISDVDGDAADLLAAAVGEHRSPRRRRHRDLLNAVLGGFSVEGTSRATNVDSPTHASVASAQPLTGTRRPADDAPTPHPGHAPRAEPQRAHGLVGRLAPGAPPRPRGDSGGGRFPVPDLTAASLTNPEATGSTGPDLAPAPAPAPGAPAPPEPGPAAAGARPRGGAVLLALASVALLALPPLWNLTTGTDWRASPRFDGDAYRISVLDVVLQALDDTGVAAVLATFERWSGGNTDEATMVALLAERGFSYRLAEFADLAASLGFEGRWIDVDATALANLKKPFVAHLEDGGGRFVIVRAVALGHVYVADPVRGQALYPMDRFAATWTGRAFAFPEPPPQPATW